MTQKKKLLVAGGVALLVLLLWRRRAKASPSTIAGEPRIELLVEDEFGGAAASEGWFSGPILSPSDPRIGED